MEKAENKNTKSKITKASPGKSSGSQVEVLRYAGFWMRLWAFLIDTLVIVGAVTLTWALHLISKVLQAFVEEGEVFREYEVMLDVFGAFMAFDVHITSLNELLLNWTTLVIWLLYTSTFEASRWQATPGKHILKLKVTDYEGKRLDFPQAFGRNFFKLFSELTLGLGYLFAGLTKHKQALHDMMAKCFVMRGN